MAKTSKPTKPQNLPAIGKLYTVPSDGSILKFSGLTKDNLLRFEYLESKTKAEPLTTTEQDLAHKLRHGIFQPI